MLLIEFEFLDKLELLDKLQKWICRTIGLLLATSNNNNNNNNSNIKSHIINYKSHINNKSHIINYMDYLHCKNQINLPTGKFLINMPIQLLN